MGEDVEENANGSGGADEVYKSTTKPLIEPDQKRLPDAEAQIKRPKRTCREPPLLPPPFERASKRRFYNLQYDSTLIEAEHNSLVFAQRRRRLRIALLAIMACAFVWALYFIASQPASIPTFVVALIMALFSLGCYAYTYHTTYRQYWLLLSFTFAAVLVLVNLLLLVICSSDCTDRFAIEVYTHMVASGLIILFYTFIPLPLWVAFVIGAFISISADIPFSIGSTQVGVTLARVLMSIGLHLLGAYLHVVFHSFSRATFWRLALSMWSRKKLLVKKTNMVYSLMPPQFAKEAMRGADENRKGSSEDSDDSDADEAEPRPGSGPRGVDNVMTFRPFNVSQLENVSILYLPRRIR